MAAQLLAQRNLAPLQNPEALAEATNLIRVHHIWPNQCCLHATGWPIVWRCATLVLRRLGTLLHQPGPLGLDWRLRALRYSQGNIASLGAGICAALERIRLDIRIHRKGR